MNSMLVAELESAIESHERQLRGLRFKARSEIMSVADYDNVQRQIADLSGDVERLQAMKAEQEKGA